MTNNSSILPFKTIIKTGLLVGVLDAIAASVHAYAARGIMPEGVFRYVASGAFGQSAFTGNWTFAVWGLLFHFLIALSWTGLFFLVYPKIREFGMNYIVRGIMYGIVVWLMMNFVVVPLSQITPRPFQFLPAIPQILIHMFIIGLTISYFANHFYARR